MTRVQIAIFHFRIILVSNKKRWFSAILFGKTSIISILKKTSLLFFPVSKAWY